MERMIFFNGGWMASYDGVRTESIIHGGAYIDEHGFGGEVYNFRNSGDNYHGYVAQRSSTINLERIDMDQSAAEEFLENVICVFVATHPEGGRRIVGWYRNAKVFSQYQHYSGKDRKILTSQDDWDDYSDQVGYYTCAKSNDVVLLTLDERLDAPQVPNGKGGFGQSNVWYADTDIGIDFRRKTYEYILRYEKNATTENNAEHRREERGRTDVTLKKKVEETAIKRTREYYENLGYTYKSVESENLGWDLEFCKGNVKLLVEVKGLSQSYISVMLSRNEYEKMRDNLENYRLAVVTNCLDQSQRPTINVFSFIQEKNGWYDKHDHELIVEELVSARCEIR